MDVEEGPEEANTKACHARTRSTTSVETVTLNLPGISNEDLSPQDVPVGARLQLFWQAWKKYKVDPFVLQVLKEGYQIPFVAKPPTSPVPLEYPSYLGNVEKFRALEKEVQEMLEKRAIEEVSEVG